MSRGSTSDGIVPGAESLDDQFLHSLIFDPFSDEVRADPYPAYRRIRETRPFSWHPAGFWIATRWADCDAVLRDRRFATVNPNEWQSMGLSEAVPEATRLMRTVLRRTILFASPEGHQRLRGLLNRAFAPRVVERRRERIRRLADNLIDRFPASGTFDFMEAFGSPFPILVMADVFGVPPQDHAMFVDWSRTISPILDPILRPEAVERVSRTMRDFDTYMRAMLRERGQAPRDDLVSIMQQPGEDGSRLSEDELVANIGFLIAAGHGTTTHLVGNGVWTLLQRPPTWRSLVGPSNVFATLIDEVLRFEAPAQMTMREATENVSVAGRVVLKGRRVLVLIGAANRDPARFARPDVFDPYRHPNEHLALSAGPHFCLGAALARVEGQEAFRALAERCPDLELSGSDWRWQETITMRGFQTLPVRQGPTPPS